MALGLLVGLQRERTDRSIAGLRTFGLVALVGAVSALFGIWMVATGLLGLAALVVTANLVASRQGPIEPGITTETALLLLYLVGALCVAGPLVMAVVVAGSAAVVLHFKRELHGAVHRLSDADTRALFTFVLLSLVILPVLPDEGFGPYEVLNPQEIWLMVVLVVGLGLAGYLSLKALGERAGLLLGGLLGGLVSSTATTFAYARRAGEGAVPARFASLVVLLASVVVFPRVLVEIAVVAPDTLLPRAAGPLSVVAAVLAGTAVVYWRRREKGAVEVPDVGNPSELRPALVFAGLYALVLLAVAWAQDRFGGAGLYVVAVVSGLTDVDALTLSTARLVERSQLAPEPAWRAILIAVAANLVFKMGVVVALAGRAVRRDLAIAWGLGLGVAGAVLFFWPG